MTIITEPPTAEKPGATRTVLTPTDLFRCAVHGLGDLTRLIGEVEIETRGKYDGASRRYVIPAFIFGDFAIHPYADIAILSASSSFGENWIVTHRPTGQSVMGLAPRELDFNQALLMVGMLLSSGIDWSGADVAVFQAPEHREARQRIRTALRTLNGAGGEV